MWKAVGLRYFKRRMKHPVRTILLEMLRNHICLACACMSIGKRTITVFREDTSPHNRKQAATQLVKIKLKKTSVCKWVKKGGNVNSIYKNSNAFWKDNRKNKSQKEEIRFQGKAKLLKWLFRIHLQITPEHAGAASVSLSGDRML